MANSHKMSVYIAAPWECRDLARAALNALALHGIGCTSRWITDEGATAINDEWARNDLHDVLDADALVALNPPGWERSGTGGRHVEFGYAVAQQMPIFLVGVRSNIFHHLNEVVVVESLDELIAKIAEKAA